jgi:L-arabinonolactonase
MEVICLAEVEDVLGEGPIWHPTELALYWVDALGCMIRRYTPQDAGVRSWPTPEPIGSLVFRAEGGIIAGMKSGFRLVDLDNGTFETVADPQPGESILLNDGKCDRRGRYWCGTMDMSLTKTAGILWRLDEDFSYHAMDQGITVSNGIAWSPDDTVMYYADTRAETVYAYDFNIEDGTVHNRRVFLSTADLPGRVDGATVDTEGGYWCAMIHAGYVARYTPDGQFDRKINLPVSHPTMCTFGGDNLDELYITSATRFLDDEGRKTEPLAGALFVVRDIGAKGLVEPFFAG